MNDQDLLLNMFICYFLLAGHAKRLQIKFLFIEFCVSTFSFRAGKVTLLTLFQASIFFSFILFIQMHLGNQKHICRFTCIIS
jgi:hypothetical protein